MAWLKLNLHCFSPTGRSDLGRELANPGCFMSLNFVNLKQIVCVQAMLRWGGLCLGCLLGPQEVEQVLLQSQVGAKESQTTSPPARYKAESLKSITANH